MPVQTNRVLLNGETYQLVSDSQLPAGKRAWSRQKRKSQPSDPGVQKVASWRINGPHGLSREDPAGGLLAVDYTENMDTLYESLLLPGPKRNPIDLLTIAQASQFVATAEVIGTPTTATFSAANTFNITPDVGTAVGDLVVVVISAANQYSVTPPSGFTANEPNISGDPTSGIYYRRIDATGALTFNFAANETGIAAAITFRGVDLFTPVNAVGAWGNDPSGVSSVDSTAPSVTSAVDNALLTGVWTKGSPAGTFTAPSGMAEIVDARNGIINLMSATASVDAGATGTRTATLSAAVTSTSRRNVLFVVASYPVYTAAFGAFPFGAAPFGGGTASSVPQTVVLMDEDRGEVFLHGGAFSFQVNPTTMEAVAFKQWDANVRGAAMWRNKGYLGLGSLSPMQRRVSVSSATATYADVEIDALPVYAGPVVVGPDRIWMVDPEDSTDSVLRYSQDQLVTRSNPFLVGDPGIPNTGLGTYGRSALAGSEIGAFGFTDLGISTRVLESLRGQRNAENAKWIQTLWGWSYITTSIGLKATIPGQVENPAGPGADRRYEGPNGRVIAVWPYKDALFASVLTPEGNTYIYRGEFDDGRYGGSTASTGRPAWFPFAYLEGVECAMVGSTGARTNPTLITGDDQNADYWTLSSADRDISDPLYRYFTGTSRWYGTTMLRSPNLHKNPRYFVLQAEDVDASNYFQIALKVDSRDYVNVGSAIVTDGHKFIYPATAGVPLTTVSGHFYKPQIICTSADDTTPPKLRGTLDMVYDERPDTIVEHVFVIELNATRNTLGGAITDLDNLGDLFSAHGSGAASPFAFQLPGQTTTVYGLAVSVEEITDMKPDGIQKVRVVVQEWPTGDDE